MVKAKKAELGHLLRCRFADAGITCASMAKKLNVSNSAVSSWVTGKCAPPALRLRQMQDVLGMTDEERLASFDLLAFSKGAH